MFTRRAGVWLKKMVGGSAFTPSMFFGTIMLLSTLARTRSSAMTLSGIGMLVISVMISCTCDLSSVGKLASVTFIAEKSTSRSDTDTRVSAVNLIVPSVCLGAPFGVYDTAEYATI